MGPTCYMLGQGSCLGTVMRVYGNTTIQMVLELVQICVLFDGSDESIKRILGREMNGLI